MLKPSPALPARPSFPVFGLTESFVGRRWLALWNAPSDVYTVTLGHGDPAGDDWVSVTTVLERDAVSGQPGVVRTGAWDAFIDAAGRIDQLGEQPGRHELGLMVDAERELKPRVGQLQTVDSIAERLSGWERATQVVDGKSRLSWQRSTAWATASVVSLSKVVVATTGRPAMSQGAVSLEDVRDRLVDYT